MSKNSLRVVGFHPKSGRVIRVQMTCVQGQDVLSVVHIRMLYGQHLMLIRRLGDSLVHTIVRKDVLSCAAPWSSRRAPRTTKSVVLTLT